METSTPEKKEKPKTIEQKLLLVQKEVEAIKKDSKNPFFKSMYFDINSLLEELKPVLNKHGLIVLQPLTYLDGQPAIKSIITDCEPGSIPIVDICPLPVMTEKTVKKYTKDGVEAEQTVESTDPQKMGAVITYFRRYALQSLFLLQAEDDDAETAVNPVARQASTPLAVNDKQLNTCLNCGAQFHPKVGMEWAKQCFECYKAKKPLTQTKVIKNPDYEPDLSEIPFE